MKLTDWRGKPIEKGAAVLYRSSSDCLAWKLGVVEDTTDGRLVIRWAEEESPNMRQPVGRNISPERVTVWPQPTNS
jgi:hypothetical protein